MSEFKFACPVCGQHITADSATSGGQLECPTCFQKIVVPQAPSSPDSKFILSAAQVGKPRPQGSAAHFGPIHLPTERNSVLATLALFLVLGVAGAAVFVFREKIFKSGRDQSLGMAKSTNAPIKVYPVPTNIVWTLELAHAVIPEANAVGSIHNSGFFCEKAILQGGHLTLRQGKTGAADLGLTVQLFAQQGEDLSGKTVEVGPERPPPIPKVVMRWKDDQQKAITRSINGGYALRVEFGGAANGRMPGRIYIGLPDENKSFVAGTFDAEIRKPPPPKPKPAG
jgi:hypothetical protein